MTRTPSHSAFNLVATMVLVVCALIVTSLIVWQQFFAPVPDTVPAQPQIRELTNDDWIRIAGETEEGIPVTIVEFFDFQCSFCKQNLPALAHIAQVFGSDVRLIRRHLPLEQIHPAAVPAALAVECAREQGVFDEYYAILFENQDSLSTEREFYADFAEEVGIPNLRAFTSCLTNAKAMDTIEADADLARELGISSTPTLVINGTVFPGAQTAESLERIVRSLRGE